jgi:N-acetylglucosaminyldiphosphoundecaprenol N-acetyl-beta-D-mannosaminyltransferase
MNEQDIVRDDDIKVEILSIGIHSLSFDQAMERAFNMMSGQNGRACYIVTANPEMVIAAGNDPELAEVISEADLVVPDGIGLVWASKMLDFPLPARIAGIDLAAELLKRVESSGLKVYFLGAKPGVAQKAAERLRMTMTRLEVAGCHHGYFSLEEEEKIIEEINRIRPHLLLVALGLSKQEKWMARAKKQGLNVGLMIGVGGSLDVFAGCSKRAPIIWRKIGLEWLYRLLRQPSRLRRYKALPAFAFKVLAEKIKKGKP